MKLYEVLGETGYHTTISTTFGIDFDAYENIVLSRLRSANCFNNLVLVDGRMLTLALESSAPKPEFAGRLYSVAPVVANGVFHPKITLQFGRKSARLLIGSANLTASGLAGNLELAGALKFDGTVGPEMQIIAATWSYLQKVLPTSLQSMAHQVEWMRDRTPWLRDIASWSEVLNLSDGTAAALFTASGTKNERGIAARYIEAVGDQPVKRLLILSPYWDGNLVALRELVKALAPKQVILFIDKDAALFPAHALKQISNCKVYDIASLGKGRFVHAKAIIAETGKVDHVLYGSANCTLAALGGRAAAAGNFEACLYRRIEKGIVLSQLGLDELLESSHALEPNKLPTFVKAPEIALDEAAVRSPGSFESMIDVLKWTPPNPGLQIKMIDLLNGRNESLPIKLQLMDTTPGDQRRYRMVGASERPLFARLVYEGGQTSAIAVVTALDSIQEAVRERRSHKAESAVAKLSLATEEGLWLWEVLEQLNSLEIEEKQAEPSSRSVPSPKTKPSTPAKYEQLSYADFVAGRRLHSDKGNLAYNSLAGSDFSLVRSYLNRILTIPDTATINEDKDDGFAAATDLGDETSDGADALEKGAEFTASKGPPTPTTNVPPSNVERATRDQIFSAADRFMELIRERAQARKITVVDVLRMRAMLMILLSASKPVPGTALASALQVLPLSAQGWPLRIGQLLFTFFGGPQPAVSQLSLSTVYDRLPDDVLETWATAMWSINAAICCAREIKAFSVVRSLTVLAEHLYRLTALRPEELVSSTIRTVFEKISDRFSSRLGLNVRDLDDGHLACVDRLKLPESEKQGASTPRASTKSSPKTRHGR